MKSKGRFTLAAFFLTAAIGFVWPFWPLCALGVALLSLSGSWFAAIVVALLIDLAWGPPTGFLHAVYLPFTLFALALCAARWWGSEYFIDRARQERL